MSLATGSYEIPLSHIFRSVLNQVGNKISLAEAVLFFSECTVLIQKKSPCMFYLDAGFCFLGSNVVLLLHVKPDNSSYNCRLLFSELTPYSQGSRCDSCWGIRKGLVEEVGHEPSGKANFRRKPADNKFIVTLVNDDTLPPLCIGVAIVSVKKLFENVSCSIPPRGVKSYVRLD